MLQRTHDTFYHHRDHKHTFFFVEGYLTLNIKHDDPTTKIIMKIAVKIILN